MKNSIKYHHSFSHYQKYDESYYKGNQIYLFLNNVDNWDDEADKKNFTDDKYKYYVICMNYQIDESVAMWKFYGYPNNIMIRYNPSFLRNNLGINKTSNVKQLDCIFTFKKGKEVNIKVDANELNVFDVLYYSRSKDDFCKNKRDSKYYIEKGTFSLKDVSYDILNKLNPMFLKRNSFSFEKEIRFYFKIDNKSFENMLKNNDLEFEEYKLTDLENIKVIIKLDNINENLKIVKIPSFLIPVGSNDNNKKIEKLKKIPNWDIDVSDSSLGNTANFIKE